MATNLLNKITAKTINGGKPKAPKNDGEYLPIMQVYGNADQVAPDHNDYGEFVKIRGQIGAVNMATGEKFRSGEAILPRVAEQHLAPAIRQAERDGGAVQFAYEIGIKGDDSSVTGYVYTATPLIEDEESDPLAQLEAQVGGTALEDKSKGSEAKGETKGETKTETKK